MNSKDKVLKLQSILSEHNIDGYMIPREDEYQNEEVTKASERLHWLTDFTGSAGLAIVLKDKSALFVDGRYTTQATQQTDLDVFEQLHLIKDPFTKWIIKNVPTNSTIAVDGNLFLHSKFEKSHKELAKHNIKLITLSTNLIDSLWQDQPQQPTDKIVIHGMEYAGRSSEDKINSITKTLKEKDTDAIIINNPSCLAWLLNIRGRELKNTPFVLAFAILQSDKTCDIFIDERKLTAETTAYLEKLCNINPLEKFHEALANFSNKKVHLDTPFASENMYQIITSNNGTCVDYPCPISVEKCHKNPIEVEGFEKAHVLDGVAMVKFIKYMREEVEKGTNLSELSLADDLERIRRENPNCLGLSFESIIGFNANAALPHYRATKDNFSQVTNNGILLIDSGGQYLSGTTDITRTFAFGNVPQEFKDNATLVLKGHLALINATFPNKTHGAQLDTLARMHLWNNGLNFDHGTGHGVGSHLSVHEGPVSISPRTTNPHSVVEVGNCMSVEPGYYKEGHYGIRIENLAIAQKSESDGFLNFNNITYCPIDFNIINQELLSVEDKTNLNNYHQLVFQKLSPLLDDTHKQWLKENTKPL